MVWSLALGPFCNPHWSSKQIEAASSHSWFILIPSVAYSCISNVKLAQMDFKWSELALDQFKSFLTRENQFWPLQIYFDQFKLILPSWSLRSVNPGRWLKTMLIWATARNQVLKQMLKLNWGLGKKTDQMRQQNIAARVGWGEAQKKLVAPKPIYFKRWEAILRS